mgnify:CR=1 FL=1
MKLNRIALAVLLAAPMPMMANAGITVTPLMLGYHYMNEAHDDQRAVLLDRLGKGTNPSGYQGLNSSVGGVALINDAYIAGSIGYELTPWMGVEVEYGQTNGDAQASDKAAQVKFHSQPWDYKQQQLTANVYVTSDLITQNYDSALRPYVLLGVGHSKIEVDVPAAAYTPAAPKSLNINSKDTIGNLGLGAFYRINDTISLRGEARAIHNFDNNWWEGMALAGLQVVLGGHLSPDIPTPPPAEPVAPPPAPEPVPVPVPPPAPAPVDTDGDGVTDDIDQCPNSPAGVVVDEKGCPKEVVEDLKMELRVFFDVNKSNIKDQYKPEIAKVAEKLKEFPTANAKLEGHTDNTGPRKLNERLSLARANAVKTMLTNEYGIAAERMSTEGFAADRPIAPNNTAEGRAMNRRVYAVITGVRSVMMKEEAAQ